MPKEQFFRTLRSLAEPKSDLASVPSMKSSTSGREMEWPTSRQNVSGAEKSRQIRMAAARET